MQELIGYPRTFAGTVVKLRFRKTSIVEHLSNDPSTRAAWIRSWKFSSQNSCLNFCDHMKNKSSVCTRIISRGTEFTYKDGLSRRLLVATLNSYLDRSGRGKLAMSRNKDPLIVSLLVSANIYSLLVGSRGRRELEEIHCAAEQ